MKKHRRKFLGTAALTIPTTALSTAWFIRNDKEPTSKEASAFEKAFSKAISSCFCSC